LAIVIIGPAALRHWSAFNQRVVSPSAPWYHIANDPAHRGTDVPNEDHPMMAKPATCDTCGIPVSNADRVDKYSYHQYKDTYEISLTFCPACAEEEARKYTYGEPEEVVMDAMAFWMERKHGIPMTIRWITSGATGGAVLVSRPPDDSLPATEQGA
jgi:hypothetical protein